jgi:hypothetical protein
VFFGECLSCLFAEKTAENDAEILEKYTRICYNIRIKLARYAALLHSYDRRKKLWQE